jgi:uncharacterized protein YhfF
MVEASKRFKFGWFGDGGLGERLIQAILEGHKTATSCPAYDPEDADLQVGDKLELVDKHGRARGTLVVMRVELRIFGSYDDALAAAEGTTLQELLESTRFANGRELRPDEEMRVVYFKLAAPRKVGL